MVPFMRQCAKILYFRQATDDNMAHALCMLDTRGYKHTLRICNTYCFSTVTVVTRTRLNVMFICTLSFLFLMLKEM
jgi:hypothetical protein